jgi:hypothetical protein
MFKFIIDQLTKGLKEFGVMSLMEVAAGVVLMVDNNSYVFILVLNLIVIYFIYNLIHKK